MLGESYKHNYSGQKFTNDLQLNLNQEDTPTIYFFSITLVFQCKHLIQCFAHKPHVVKVIIGAQCKG